MNFLLSSFFIFISFISFISKTHAHHRHNFLSKGQSTRGQNHFELEYSKKKFNFWIKYFTNKEKKRFIRHMKNGKRYKKLTDRIFSQYKLPTELFYVGLIESGYNTKIKSRSGAVGPWQFIKGTATRYGLRVDSSIDERRNIFKATKAAARYFKDLYNIFGSWELALCAYNKGEYGLIRAIRKGKTRNYLELIKKRLIPKETAYYIPKIMASKELYDHPQKHSLPRPKNNGHKFLNTGKILLKKTTNIRAFARKKGLSYSSLRFFNPDLLSRSIKIRRSRPLELYLPQAMIKSISFDLKSSKKKIPSSPQDRIYRVKKGDHLSAIAKRFGLSHKQLISKNNLSHIGLKIGQKLYLPRQENRLIRIKKVVYKVKKGDSLIKIAKKFNISVSQIRSLNSLRNNVIYLRQKLIIPSNS